MDTEEIEKLKAAVEIIRMLMWIWIGSKPVQAVTMKGSRIN